MTLGVGGFDDEKRNNKEGEDDEDEFDGGEGYEGGA